MPSGARVYEPSEFSQRRTQHRGALRWWFIVIALVPCLLLTGIMEYLTSQALDKTVRRGLLVIAEAKSAAFDAFIRERRGDAHVAGHLPSVIDATKQLIEILKTKSLDSAEYHAAASKYTKVLNYYREAYGYENLFLFAVDGKLLLRLEAGLDMGTNLKRGPLKDSALAVSFDEAKALLQSSFSDYQIYPGSDAPKSFIVQPVFESSGAMMGVLALQLSNKEIYRILNDTNGLGETGEVVVGALKGDEVTLVAPTRFAPDAAFRRKVKMGSLEAIPLQNAVLGKRGFGRMLDYRGVTAAACWAYIPSLRWGVVVKMDESEAYEMIRRVRAAIVVLLVVTLFFVALVATLIARSLSRPVVAVVELANKVAGGDLTADTDIKAHGEVGRLIQSVRRMTSDLPP